MFSHRIGDLVKHTSTKKIGIIVRIKPANNVVSISTHAKSLAESTGLMIYYVYFADMKQELALFPTELVTV